MTKTQELLHDAESLDYSEEPDETPLDYCDVPFLTDLSPESIAALKEEQFTVTTIQINVMGSEMAVPILTWEGIERSIADLRELFGEPISDLTDLAVVQSSVDEHGQASFISEPNYHLGDLTDAEFQKQFFENTDFFAERKIGSVASFDVAQSIKGLLEGRLHDVFHTDNIVGTAANLDLPAPGLQLTSRDHMIWMVGNPRLDDLPITRSDRRVARVTAILHDWGKIVMFQNRQHPEIGAAMARSILLYLHQEEPTLYPIDFVNDVCWSISMHHLLERIFQPLKKDSLAKLSKQRIENRGLWPYQTKRRFAKKSEDWFLYQSAQTNLENNRNEHVISIEQYHNFMEFLRILAYYEKLPATQHAIEELTELLRNPNAKNIGLLLTIVRVIEADLVATDRPPSETAFRLNQLQLVLQGILATAEA